SMCDPLRRWPPRPWSEVLIEATQNAPAGSGAISRNVLWNLAGEAAPLLAGVFCIPFLIHGLGTERFGILSLAWALVSYFAILDIGLGRALTKLSADTIASGTREEIPALFWAAFTLMLVFGVASGALMAATSSWLV